MKLLYVMDPMCSWCWGFRPKFQTLLGKLPPGTVIQHVMGGLAPDSDEPMPVETREYIQSQWRAVTEATGATFNWDFWTQCQPRRSTYPACRAVIAAGKLDDSKKPDMILAIQRAYYEQSRNPSDSDTLIELASEIGLDTIAFSQLLTSAEVNDSLHNDLAFAKTLGVRGFPGVYIQHEDNYHWLADSQTGISDMLATIQQIKAQPVI